MSFLSSVGVWPSAGFGSARIGTVFLACLLACVAWLPLMLMLLLLLVLLDVDHNPTNRFIQQILTEKVVNPSIPRITQTVLHHALLHPQHR